MRSNPALQATWRIKPRQAPELERSAEARGFAQAYKPLQ